MERMKAVVYEKPGRANARIKEIPRPACTDDGVLMKVMSCGICKAAEISHDRNGSLLGAYPAVPGHEFSGIAVEVGKNVTHVKVGDRITADNGVQCGTCHSARPAGRPVARIPVRKGTIFRADSPSISSAPGKRPIRLRIPSASTAPASASSSTAL